MVCAARTSVIEVDWRRLDLIAYRQCNDQPPTKSLVKSTLWNMVKDEPLGFHFPDLAHEVELVRAPMKSVDAFALANWADVQRYANGHRISACWWFEAHRRIGSGIGHLGAWRGWLGEYEPATWSSLNEVTAGARIPPSTREGS